MSDDIDVHVFMGGQHIVATSTGDDKAACAYAFNKSKERTLLYTCLPLSAITAACGEIDSLTPEVVLQLKAERTDQAAPMRLHNTTIQ